MKHLRFAVILVLCLGLAGCSENAAESSSVSAPAQPTWQTISPETARDMMDEADSYVLLDVRTQEEYTAGHIDGAVLIPDFEISQRAEAELPDKDAVILVYCRSGRRSALAAQELAAMGYTNVYDFGGIQDWGYDIVRE